MKCLKAVLKSDQNRDWKLEVTWMKFYTFKDNGSDSQKKKKSHSALSNAFLKCQLDYPI